MQNYVVKMIVTLVAMGVGDLLLIPNVTAALSGANSIQALNMGMLCRATLDARGAVDFGVTAQDCEVVRTHLKCNDGVGVFLVQADLMSGHGDNLSLTRSAVRLANELGPDVSGSEVCSQRYGYSLIDAVRTNRELSLLRAR